MTTQQWDRRPVPAVPGGGQAVGEWELRSPIDLTVSRGQLRDAALRTPPPGSIGLDELQRLLLAFEELAANGLRHGHAPVQVRVVGTAEGWLIDVSDAAANRPPASVTGSASIRRRGGARRDVVTDECPREQR